MWKQPWREQMCLGEWTASSVGQLRNRELRYPGKCGIIPPFSLIVRSDGARQAIHVHKLHAKHIKPCFYVFQDCISQQLTLLESWNPKTSHVIYSTFSLDTWKPQGPKRWSNPHSTIISVFSSSKDITGQKNKNKQTPIVCVTWDREACTTEYIWTLMMSFLSLSLSFLLSKTHMLWECLWEPKERINY